VNFISDIVRQEGFTSFVDIVDEETLKSKHSRIAWLTNEDCERHVSHPQLGQHFKKEGYKVCE
jgi:hypothetical protein